METMTVLKETSERLGIPEGTLLRGELHFLPAGAKTRTDGRAVRDAFPLQSEFARRNSREKSRKERSLSTQLGRITLSSLI